MASVAIAQDLQASVWIKLGFVLVALYFLGLPFLRHSPWSQD
jgi:hypothetical protein